MSSEPWYAAKCIFRHANLSREGDHVYEERIVLIRAASFDDALAEAEDEALRYADNGVEYMGFIDVYHLSTDELGDGAEVYSLLRSSKLPPADYLNTFHDTGAEHSRED